RERAANQNHSQEFLNRMRANPTRARRRSKKALQHRPLTALSAKWPEVDAMRKPIRRTKSAGRRPILKARGFRKTVMKGSESCARPRPVGIFLRGCGWAG